MTAVSAVVVNGAQAATAWDEWVSGDLSNQGMTPTVLTIGLGSNLVIGTTWQGSGIVDRDYFTFTLPDGWQLDALTVLPASGFGGPRFTGVQSGPQVTVDPAGGSMAGLLGWRTTTAADIGSNILPSMGQGAGAIGFDGPLPAGTYAFWIQEAATGYSAFYSFDLSVSAVPEPTMPLLMLSGLGVVVSLFRRRRTK